MATRPEGIHKGAARKDGALAILSAAERLFGCHGLDGITIRQITLAAGMGNNSAVAYHFGDKEGLLRAICKWRNPVLEQAGETVWRKAEEERRLDHAASLIGVLLRPFVAVTDGDGRHSHAAFMYQMLRSPGGRAIRVSLFDISRSTAKALERLYVVLPHVPPALLRYRLRIAGAAFFDGLGEWDLGVRDPDFPELSLAELVDELIGMAAAACMRPSGAASE